MPTAAKQINITAFDRRCLREICVRRATSAMELSGRLSRQRGHRHCCMSVCWVSSVRLRQAGLVYLTSHGDLAATIKGRRGWKQGK